MGDPWIRMGTLPVWESGAHGDLRGMGCSVWPARCRIADLQFFVSCWRAADAYGGPSVRAYRNPAPVSAGMRPIWGNWDAWGRRECTGAPFEYGEQSACMGPENP